MKIIIHYTLVQSFEVPFSPYVSSVQEYDGNLIIDSGMKGVLENMMQMEFNPAI